MEKPNAERAEQFLQSGRYLWNSGILCWRVSVIMELFQKLMPGLYAHLMESKLFLGTAGAVTRVISEVYPRMEKETIDYGIMEKAPEVVVVPTALRVERRRELVRALRGLRAKRGDQCGPRAPSRRGYPGHPGVRNG